MKENEKRLEEAASRVYRYMMHSKPEEWGDHKWADWAMNIDRWDWNPGVGLIAAEAYGEPSARGEVLRDVETWTRRNLGQSETVKVINAIAPFAVFPRLYRETGERYYAERAEAIARWLMDEAPRTRSGAYEHTVTEQASFSEQIWADTVFMAVLFLARTARLLANGRMADEALRQALLHLQALQDEESGLLYHGRNCEAGDWMSAAKWNRANAWNAVGIPMILEEVEGLAGDAETLREIKRRYLRLAEALAARQSDGGLWPTVLDRPGYYAETSGSAGIACGLFKAAAMGLVPAALADHAERALSAVLDCIGADGAVAGVSGGTPVLDSVEAYGEVPVFPTLYGQGLVLLLLTEALRQRV
ncbi:glycoside hydrolase family 88 protein [Cohnella nanjingensis]|uniref:Glycoside hydrolase family 88 protein n=1 Tax=Cohnella nanjingensis TaxID=1387779 RepID=A0A7X0VEZ5_9BACL|nr:glycoside hydrolase family 88 protein [Cohnella nanjingensis]MBB6670748.1 glycoside hydrolase family 88 protein [Cohnella nanjingensis]